MSTFVERIGAAGQATRRRVLGGAVGAAGVAALGGTPAPAKKRHCPTCRRCGKHCCAEGLRCAGGVCTAPCSTSDCDTFPVACTLFPADNVWRARVDALPVDARSDAYVASIGSTAGLHPDFGSGLWDGGPIGIPFVVAPPGTPAATIDFSYPDESDPGPYPIPPDAPIEGGPCATGDRHILIVDGATCRLSEVYDAHPRANGTWAAGSGAVFDLTSNDLRPDTWTSADAAGLPILPGLVRREEVVAGEIAHALRFTAPRTRRAYVWPARHYASSDTNPDLPPMGQRFRLKAGFDISGFSQTNRVILTALKRYGMFLADNGSAWFLSGAPDEQWDNDDLHQLQTGVHGSDFEAVDSSSLMKSADSGQVA